VRAHFATPVPISQLSHVAGLSERGLRKAFHSVRGMSPKRYLLTERLLRAHLALSDAGSNATVSDVATAYGFYELGRFAGSYKAVFGEAPSDTLRATRRKSTARPKTKGHADACTSLPHDDQPPGDARDLAIAADS
jgi:AraC family ethanolamine operon transcriptional activator